MGYNTASKETVTDRQRDKKASKHTDEQNNQKTDK